ncbi:Very short patch repair protein [Posidoniimonas polymericola]|uniref:Very short patch repair protein n=2 Tax=Posidoniimonas polymericola TaxID=2528002 RepID=A0A5C5YM72_9BACT|nr:Very short patch repair protein [Posidoniimonas polymericola]
MRAVKSRDTRPELLVARLLRGARVRYRRDVARLPGRPDFLLVEADIALFVHGCFWHGHDCPRGARAPKNNRDYWLAKIARNRRRDRRVARELREAGYAVWTLWECGLKPIEKSGELPTRLLNEVRRRGG